VTGRRLKPEKMEVTPEMVKAAFLVLREWGAPVGHLSMDRESPMVKEMLEAALKKRTLCDRTS
jgi:hypothetical protein